MRLQIFAGSLLFLGFLLLGNVYGETQSKGIDHPGIKWDWKINTDNNTFHVTTVSNYDMQNVTFNKTNKELIFTGNSTHDGNIAEIEIPSDLIGGNLTLTQDGKPLSAIIIPGTSSSTLMLKFNQTGMTTTNVMGATYLPEFSSLSIVVMLVSIVMMLFVTNIRKI